MPQTASSANSAGPMAASSEGLTIGGLRGPLDALMRLRAIQEQALHSKGRQQQAQAELPLWAETVRGVPNTLLRTALFTISKGRGVFKGRELLASTIDIELRFKGERFNQTDLDVWEMLLHFARLQPLGSKVQFSAYSLLRALGRSTGTTQYEQLKDEISRLQGGVIEISWKKEKRTFSGQLVGSAYRDDVTQQYVVILNEKLLRLYDDGFTYVDWTQRQVLKSNLTKWLHGFYASHAATYPYKVETLRELCGSDTKQLRNFRRMLRAAMDDLVVVGAIKEWEITPDDLVRVVTVPSNSQVKHIKKKATRARIVHGLKPLRNSVSKQGKS